MASLIKKLRGRRAGVVARTVRKVEDRILIAQGRKTIRRKAERVAQVTRTAARAGVIAGTAAAVMAARREIRRGRREA